MRFRRLSGPAFLLAALLGLFWFFYSRDQAARVDVALEQALAREDVTP